MTYEEVFNRASLLTNIPMIYDGRELSKTAATDVILLQVGYTKKVEEYEAVMSEVLKKLKKDGFDERAQAIQSMEDIYRRVKAHDEWSEKDDSTRPARPTDEEVVKADETAKTKDDFDKEVMELNSAYISARAKKAEEEVTMNTEKMSRDTYESIIELIGFNGEISFKPINGNEAYDMPKQEFLYLLATRML